MQGDDHTWYVVPVDRGWVVTERTRGGAKMFPSKEAAVRVASELARATAPAGYQVRRADGSIEREVRFDKRAADLPRRNLRTPADAPASKRLRRDTRLLLVDDDPLVRSSFGRLLSSRGWEVVLAEDCPEAERSLGASGVAVAVIDLCMVGSLDLAEGLLAQGRTGRVVFFTGQDPEAWPELRAAPGVVVAKAPTTRLLEALQAS